MRAAEGLPFKNVQADGCVSFGANKAKRVALCSQHHETRYLHVQASRHQILEAFGPLLKASVRSFAGPRYMINRKRQRRGRR